jgi:RHS repeat-associated protein
VTVLGAGLDNAVLRISRTYDALDRSLNITSYNNATVGLGSAVNDVQYAYDKFNTVTNLYEEWNGAVTTGTSRKVQFAFSYPTNGTTGLRLTSTTYTGGKVITEIYNTGTDDTLSRISGRNDGTTQLFRDSYLGLGRLVERQYNYPYAHWTLVGTSGANQDNYLGLERFGRIQDLIVNNTFSGQNINEYYYTYNFNSQITVREDLVGNVLGSQEFDETYDYDNLGRIIDHKRGVYTGSMSSIRWHECWTLDRSGNSTQYGTSSGSTCSYINSTFNASNEITSRIGDTGYAVYNAAGDMTTKGGGTGKTMVYDAWNRLVSITGPGGTLSTYSYNGLGQLIKRTSSPSLLDVYYHYNDKWQMVEERKVSDGTVQFWYCWGTQYIDDLVARGPTLENYILDARNNVATRLSSSGSVINRYVYDAYGTPKQLSYDWTQWQTITADLYLFTGRQWHLDPALYDTRMRNLDPELGLFPQRDPIGIWGDKANFGNGYGYVRNNPVNRRDPSGKQVFQAGFVRVDNGDVWEPYDIDEDYRNCVKNGGERDCGWMVRRVQAKLPPFELPGGIDPPSPPQGPHISESCPCAEENWDCDQICAEAQAQGLDYTRNGTASVGGVICCAGHKCPCVWPTPGMSNAAIDCTKAHEASHMDFTDCDPAKCLHRPGFTNPTPAKNNQLECQGDTVEIDCLIKAGEGEGAAAQEAIDDMEARGC